MHPYLSHRNYLSPTLPYARTHRTGSEKGGILRRWLQTFVRQWKRRKMIASLVSMDDRLLRDIGVQRSEIRSIVDGLSDGELGMNPLAPNHEQPSNDEPKYLWAA